MAEVLKVIGLMSGTSLDGVDAALLETDGESVVISGPALTIPYEEIHRKALREALALAPSLSANDKANPIIRTAAMVVNTVHAVAVKELRRQAKLTPRDIAYLGFHGQTILHRPAEHRTWQLGDGARLAHATGIPVVNDFRSADVAAGGQGAPLAPLYHAALVSKLRLSEDVAVLNIGGVANVTYVGRDGLLAFDTGPGNAALDDWVSKRTGEPMDRGGALARLGQVDQAMLSAMLDHSYFLKPPPKSLDRMDFGFAAVSHLSAADGAATLTAFTAACAARALEHMPGTPARWIVCGGGRHNPALMEALGIFVRAPILKAEDVGWRGDVLEAAAFAYLAARSVKGLPLSLPTTTGVPRPTTGGRLHPVA